MSSGLSSDTPAQQRDEGDQGAKRLRRALACPRCRGHLAGGGQQLVCRACGAPYVVQDGIFRLVAPDMRADETANFYGADDPPRFGRDAAGMPAKLANPVSRFVDSLESDALVVEVGSGRGGFDAIAPNYVAIDLSFSALRRYSTGLRVQASAEALPFKDSSVDAIFTVATLEHVPHPERGLAEIDRCLRPGGSAFIYPAWYVRPWAARALHKRSFSELGAVERVSKLTIPIRDRREFQFARVLPRRIAREVLLLRGRPLAFGCRKLSPNLDEYVTSDSDAFSSMDPHAAACYFLSRSYQDLRRPTFGKRLVYGYEPVVVRK